MAQNQVTQMLNDELDKMSSAMNKGLKQLDARLKKLEQPESGQSSESGAPSSATRRKAFDKLVNSYDNQADRDDLKQNPPLCRTCKHAMLLDGYIMQYQSGQNYPRYIPTGFVQCQQLGTQMPFETAPRKICMFKETDEPSNG